MHRVNWDQCPAYAAQYDENGVARVIVPCTLGAHCDPQDETAEHYNEDLGIRWRYSDE